MDEEMEQRLWNLMGAWYQVGKTNGFWDEMNGIAVRQAMATEAIAEQIGMLAQSIERIADIMEAKTV